MSISGKNPRRRPALGKNEPGRSSFSDLPFASGVWVTRSPAQTVALAKALGKHLKKGDVVALYGELGSGKTTFIKGLAAGLGAERTEGVRSPTFVLLNLYKGRLPVYHMDLYRVHSLDRLYDIGYDEYALGEGVVVIEWAEKAEQVLPPGTIRVSLRSVGKKSREVSLRIPSENRSRRRD